MVPVPIHSSREIIKQALYSKKDFILRAPAADVLLKPVYGYKNRMNCKAGDYIIFWTSTLIGGTSINVGQIWNRNESGCISVCTIPRAEETTGYHLNISIVQIGCKLILA